MCDTCNWLRTLIELSMYTHLYTLGNPPINHTLRTIAGVQIFHGLVSEFWYQYQYHSIISLCLIMFDLNKSPRIDTPTILIVIIIYRYHVKYLQLPPVHQLTLWCSVCPWIFSHNSPWVLPREIRDSFLEPLPLNSTVRRCFAGNGSHHRWVPIRDVMSRWCTSSGSPTSSARMA